ncbi:MAG TPA: DMT family transporter [Microbacteriaceae bacterium]|nr:DMT family transporter [Microbacteriaceae bacterium]
MTRLHSNLPVAWRFLAVGTIWGSGFYWNALALRTMDWEFIVWARGLLGAITLLAAIAMLRPRTDGRVWPRSWKTWVHFGVIGVLLAVLPNVFWTLGQLGVTVSTASIYNGVTPIVTALIAGLLFRIDVLGPRQWLGIACGIVGVTVVIAPWESSFGGGVWNQLACLAGVTSAALAFAYQRKYLAETPMHATTAAALITIGAAVVSVVFTPVWAKWPTAFDPMSWLGLLWLGVLVSGIAYIWNARVVDSWGATGASMVTYLSPVVGVALGVALLGEQLTWHAPLGGLIIVVGIALSQSNATSRSPRGAVQVVD